EKTTFQELAGKSIEKDYTSYLKGKDVSKMNDRQLEQLAKVLKDIKSKAYEKAKREILKGRR
ncbi:MAG: hypothetical protein GY787_27485, partial [Alteromonadales bacterium]|nr:hypothetical protein [Alteromonadales bacterium]